MADSVIRAAGAVLWRPRPGDGRELALVHRPHRKDWSFPRASSSRASTRSPPPCARWPRRPATRSRWAARCPAGATPSTVSPSRSGTGRPVARSCTARRSSPSTRSTTCAGCPTDRPASCSATRTTRGCSQAFDRQPVDTVPLVIVRHGKAVKRAPWSGTVDTRPPAGGPRHRAGAAGSSRCWQRLRDPGRAHLGRDPLPGHRAPVRPQPRAAGAGRAAAVRGGARRRAQGQPGPDGRARSPTPQPMVVCSHRPVLPDLLGGSWTRAEPAAASARWPRERSWCCTATFGGTARGRRRGGAAPLLRPRRSRSGRVVHRPASSDRLPSSIEVRRSPAFTLYPGQVTCDCLPSDRRTADVDDARARTGRRPHRPREGTTRVNLNRPGRLAALAVSVAGALALAACGSDSNGTASSLRRQQQRRLRSPASHGQHQGLRLHRPEERDDHLDQRPTRTPARARRSTTRRPAPAQGVQDFRTTRRRSPARTRRSRTTDLTKADARCDTGNRPSTSRWSSARSRWPTTSTGRDGLVVHARPCSPRSSPARSPSGTTRRSLRSTAARRCRTRPSCTFHRSDSSGHDRQLHQVPDRSGRAADWTFDHDKVWKAPGGQGAKGSDGVAAALKSTPNSLGYVEYSFTQEGGLGVAQDRQRRRCRRADAGERAARPSRPPRSPVPATT